MFCPNCGTKNVETALKCSQCGFDQKAKRAAPKFKGTMMLQGSPNAPPGTPGSGSLSGLGSPAPVSPAPVSPTPGSPRSDAPAPSPAASPAARKRPNPALKGTMVGVAPPGLDAIRKQAEKAIASQRAEKAAQASATPVAQKSKPNLRGTMVGVAPPGLENLRKEAETASIKKAPQPNMKGTMVGLAPPALMELRRQAEEAALEKKAASQQKSASATSAEPTPRPAASPAVRQPGPETSSGPQAPSKPAISSKLKGTMMGVAPPDMQAAIKEAKANMEAEAKAKAEKSALAAASAQKPTPDPLAGTLVGTSPFTARTEDFDDKTPAAAAEQQEATRTSSMPGELASGSDPLARTQGQQAEESPGAALEPKGTNTEMQPAVVPEKTAAPTDAPSPSPYTPTPYTTPGQELPVTKSNLGLVVGLLVVLLLAALFVAYQMVAEDSMNEPKQETTAEENKGAPTAPHAEDGE